MIARALISALMAGVAVGVSIPAQTSARPAPSKQAPLPGWIDGRPPMCGTPPREHAGPDTTSDCAYDSTTIQSQYEPTFVFDIPVVFHVIHVGPTHASNIPDATIQSQVEVLNEAFRAFPGTPGASGFDTQIQFHLATRDPDGNPTNGITRTHNGLWYQDQGDYWNTLAWDPERYINIYTNHPGSGIVGYVPDLPQGGWLVGTNEDRIVLDWEAVGRNGTLFPFDHGLAAAHEVGHFLGLYHTFEGSCPPSGAPACYTSGDLICDTNPEMGHYGCPAGASSCGLSDPVLNYMNYTDDLCKSEFTPEQSNRMRCTLTYWRSFLYAVCPGFVAASATRNSGSNPYSYEAGAPLLGGTIHLQVDLLSSNHPYALVIGFTSAFEFALGGGQMLLVDVTDPNGELLGLSISEGPLASWDVRVPAVACGIELFTQAIQFGSPPFVLSNAVDFTLGL